MRVARRSAPKCLAAPLTLAALLGFVAPGSAINVVHGVILTPATPAALEYDTNVEILFEYETDDPAGAYIWFRPITEGAVSPSYAAHGSPVYHGAGNDSAFFTITGQEVLVDQVRVQMWNLSQDALLFEDFLPVRYHYAQSGEITQILLTPAWPASLQTEEPVDVTFDYATGHQDGVLVFFRPLSGGQVPMAAGGHASPVYPAGVGAGAGWFTILGAETAVDGVRVTMTDPTQTLVFHEFDFPVEYHFQATPARPETWGYLKSLFR